MCDIYIYALWPIAGGADPMGLRALPRGARARAGNRARSGGGLRQEVPEALLHLGLKAVRGFGGPLERHFGIINWRFEA